MVKIITDSTSDISPSMAKWLDVEVVPLEVHFGEESYLDGVNLTPSQFYEKLEKASKLPVTSQVNPAAFEEVFKKHIANGDSVVCLTLSPKLSGTYQSACIARDMLGAESIHVVDSKTVTFGLGLLVQQAVAMREREMSGKEIADSLEKLADRIRIVAAVDTLKFQILWL